MKFKYRCEIDPLNIKIFLQKLTNHKCYIGRKLLKQIIKFGLKNTHGNNFFPKIMIFEKKNPKILKNLICIFKKIWNSGNIYFKGQKKFLVHF